MDQKKGKIFSAGFIQGFICALALNMCASLIEVVPYVLFVGVAASSF